MSEFVNEMRSCLSTYRTNSIGSPRAIIVDELQMFFGGRHAFLKSSYAEVACVDHNFHQQGQFEEGWLKVLWRAQELNAKCACSKLPQSRPCVSMASGVLAAA